MVRLAVRGPGYEIVHADIRDYLLSVPDGTFDAVLADPPYGIGYASGPLVSSWDRNSITFDPAFWTEVRRVSKPGAVVAAFGHSRTSHRQAVAIEDAGLRLVDTLAWAKSHGYQAGGRDVSKQLQVAGMDDMAEDHSGFGTHLSPALEPITIARNLQAKKSLIRAIADGGSGGLNLASTRIRDDEWAWRVPVSDFTAEDRSRTPGRAVEGAGLVLRGRTAKSESDADGRLPGNLLLEHAPDCTPAACVESCVTVELNKGGRQKYAAGRFPASRFFTRLAYSPRAPASERPSVDGISAPTVKPQQLLSWLCALTVRPGALILDPFAGSGAITEAIVKAGGRAVAVEKEAAYVALIEGRMRG
jgi:hypothetical protein